MCRLEIDAVVRLFTPLLIEVKSCLQKTPFYLNVGVSQFLMTKYSQIFKKGSH